MAVAHAIRFFDSRGFCGHTAEIISPRGCFECGCQCQKQDDRLHVEVTLPARYADLSVSLQIDDQNALQAELDARWPDTYRAMVHVADRDHEHTD